MDEYEYDVIIKHRDGSGIRSRMGPYTKEQADSIKRATKSYPSEVVPHDMEACRKVQTEAKNESNN